MGCQAYAGGAGGGGCVLILARAGGKAVAAVTAVLERDHYGPLGKRVDVEPWQPTAPAGEAVFAAAASRQPALEAELAEEKAASWLAA